MEKIKFEKIVHEHGWFFTYHARVNGFTFDIEKVNYPISHYMHGYPCKVEINNIYHGDFKNVQVAKAYCQDWLSKQSISAR